MAGLGLDTYRFTVEWARVEPAEGQFSAEALARYRAIIDRCLVVTEPLGAGIAWAVTLNEPNRPPAAELAGAPRRGGPRPSHRRYRRRGPAGNAPTTPAQTGGSCTLTTAERPPCTTASASFSTRGSSAGSATVTPYAPPAARATPGRSASGSKLT